MDIPKPLAGSDYDAQWRRLSDFIAYNPGARHRRRLTLQMLEGLSFSSLLDVGCGSGDLLIALRKRFGDRVLWAGADFASETVQRTGERLGWARIVELNIAEGALSEQFDLVTCCEVIEHLADQPKAMQHLAKMVRPGGHLLVSCPTGHMFETERRFGHVHHPTQSEMKAFGQSAGLEIRRLLNWGFPSYYAQKVAANINPDFAEKQFASGQYDAKKKLLNHLLYGAAFFSLRSPLGCQLFCLYHKPA